MSFGNIHLTPQLVQAVRDTIDIVDIASRQAKLEKKGTRLWGLCPFHKEKTPSFSVDPVQGLYYCFGCGAGGDAIRLHMAGSGDDFPAAIETLAREYGIPISSVSPGSRRGSEIDVEAVLLAAEAFFETRLRDSPGARAYLSERKISDELIERFHLGYAPQDFEALLGTLRSDFPVKDLEAAGLVGSSSGPQERLYDRFRHRLMFPIRNPSGRLVGFGGRTLGDDRAKYINTRETERFQKRTVLYGLDVSRRMVREKGTILLVEGYFDLLAVVASGVGWAVATMGTALSREQARLCSRYADRVVLCYDGDSAGQEAQSRALPILLAQGLEVRRVELAEDEDPDTVRLGSGPQALLELVDGAKDAVEAELARLVPPSGDRDPAAQAKAAKSVRELLRRIPDAVLRFAYGRRAADRIGVPQDVLWRSTPRARDDQEAATKPRHRLVMSLEERVLQLLLQSGFHVPSLEELPSEKVFLDVTCGNIFHHYRALYDKEGCPPDARAVLAILSREGETLDRLARILLEEVPCSDSEELREALGQLNKRWRQHQLKTLARQIKEAQRSGETLRLQQLVEEKTSLTKLLHELAPPPGGAGK